MREKSRPRHGGGFPLSFRHAHQPLVHQRHHRQRDEQEDGEETDADVVGDALKFVKENETVKICSHKGNVFSVEPPLFVELAITETEPGFKGDTAQGATKPAVVETGATVMVPLFVEVGDVLKIDTRTGEYLSRV